MARSIHTDPRADRAALGFTALLIDETAAGRVRHGLSHSEARDRACRMFADAMVEQGGRPTADAAIRAVHTLAPAECLTRAERETVQARERADTIALFERVRGRPMGLFNRAFVHLFGAPFL